MMRFSIALIGFLLIVPAARGQSYVGTVLVESNADQSDIVAGTYTYINQLSVATLPDFNFPFSTLGDVDFSITWQAPPNYRIQITPPSGFDNVQVYFQFYSGSSGYNVGQVDPPTTLTLAGFSGSTLPSMPSAAQFTGPQTSSLPADSAGAFIFPSGFALDEPFYLSSATVEFTVPAAYDVDFNAPVAGFEVFGVAFSNQPSAAPQDPGQWITLVQVPEPSSIALLSTTGMGVLVRRRR